ncbi:MAG: RNA 2'-phosphotransferase, partial [Pyrinomonadaceae bacterium]
MTLRQVKISKFLSLVLRHDPGSVGLRLDEAGWIGVDELLLACRNRGFELTRAELQ